MKYESLPKWSDCNDLVEMGADLDPIERFIYENEPAGPEGGFDNGEYAREWRDMLLDVVQWCN